MAIFTPTNIPHNVNAFFSRSESAVWVPPPPRHLLSTYPLDSSSNIGYALHKHIRKNGLKIVIYMISFLPF
jgi:hypothetical protein